MLRFFNQSVTNDSSRKDWETMFNLVTNVQSLTDSNELTTCIRSVQALLLKSDAKKRDEGLLWLLKLVKMCRSADELKTHAELWFSTVMDILCRSDVSSYTKMLIFPIIEEILVKANFHLAQEKMDDRVQKIISAIVKSSPEDKFPEAVSCLATLMEKMPGRCKNFKELIENFLLRRCDSSDSSEIKSIATCFKYLAKLERKDVDKHWTLLCHKMLNTLSQIVEELLGFVIIDGINEEEVLKLPTSEKSPFLNMERVRQFHTVVVCVAEMLNTSNLTVEVPGIKILCMIDTFFSLSELVFQDSSPDTVYQVSLLNAMEKDVLLLLEALVLSCHEMLEEHEANIIKLLVKIMEESSVAFDTPRYRSSIRSNIYRILLSLVTKVNGSSLNDMLSGIIEILLDDIQPISEAPHEQISLIIRNNPGKRSLHFKQPAVPKTQADITAKRNNCLGALRVMSCLHISRENHHFQLLPCILVKILSRLSRHSSYPFPYDDELCRKELYSLFLSLVVQSGLMTCQPVSMALYIFQRGVKDTSTEVSRLCIWGISILNSIIHSVKPARPPIEEPLAKVPEAPSAGFKISTIQHANESQNIPVALQNHSSQSSDLITSNPMDQGDMKHHFDEQDESLQDHEMNHIDDEDIQEIVNEDDPENIETEEDRDEDDEEEEEEDSEDEEVEEEEEESEEYGEYLDDTQEAESHVQSRCSSAENQYESVEKVPEHAMNNGGYMLNGSLCTDDEEEVDRGEEMIPVEVKKSHKRSHDFRIEASQRKKHKSTNVEDQPVENEVIEEDSMSINTMMQDFVDTPPDSDINELPNTESVNQS